MVILTLIARISRTSLELQFAFCFFSFFPPLALISKAAGRKSGVVALTRCVALFVWIHV